MTRLAGCFAAVALATSLAADGASAQTGRTDRAALDARIAWAKRQVELVCRPLEARKMFDKATRCYDDASRIVGDPAKAVPTTAPRSGGVTTPVPPSGRPTVRTAEATEFRRPATRGSATSAGA